MIYDPKANSLKAIVKGDLRKLTGLQEFVGGAPLNLVFVADTAKMKGMPAANLDPWANADASFVSENVYLYCASEGLATVVRADEHLRELTGQRIYFSFTLRKGEPAPVK